MSILEEIVKRRKQRIKRYGHDMGVPLPARRLYPLIPLQTEPGPFIICEVKRSSPSRGAIAMNVDAVKQAELYIENGAKDLSVLTEEDYFSGSLNDLYRIKAAFPYACVLRKDFILDEEDIDVSYRAGADAVLLIASLHNVEDLLMLYRRSKSLGMEVLFEVHDDNDLKKARRVKPQHTGFNSRDLSTFKIDPARPVFLRSMVDWKTSCVFESGIDSEEMAHFALSSGFEGLLVGEASMKKPSLIKSFEALVKSSLNSCTHDKYCARGPAHGALKYPAGEVRNTFTHKQPGDPLRLPHNTWTKKRCDFWLRLYTRRAAQGGSSSASSALKPLVKICGITREDDALFAAEQGADILGFVFAPSPRRADPDLPRKLSSLGVLKVGVVVLSGETEKLSGEIEALFDEGLLDAIQLHGEERPEECYLIAFPYYKALRIRNEEDVEKMHTFRCPRVLIDAFDPEIPGGTGSTIPEKYIKLAAQKHPLWLAGGIGPENVREILERFNPELIDASSKLEKSHGMKDSGKIRLFFEEIEKACSGKEPNRVFKSSR